ncbi:hypothetical protein Tco_1291806 [Tanacetum coccineum]
MTPESVQAMIDQALLRNSTNGDGSHSSHGITNDSGANCGPCFYVTFMKCQHLNFKGTEGVGATPDLWICQKNLRSREHIVSDLKTLDETIEVENDLNWISNTSAS